VKGPNRGFSDPALEALAGNRRREVRAAVGASDYRDDGATSPGRRPSRGDYRRRAQGCRASLAGIEADESPGGIEGRALGRVVARTARSAAGSSGPERGKRAGRTP